MDIQINIEPEVMHWLCCVAAVAIVGMSVVAVHAVHRLIWK